METSKLELPGVSKLENMEKTDKETTSDDENKKKNIKTTQRLKKMVSNTCSECEKNFSNYKNLRRHVLKFHPDKTQDLAPSKRNKKTSNPNKTQDLGPLKKIKRKLERKYEFTCKDCDKECEITFSNYNNLRRHVLKFHPDKAQDLAPLKRSQKEYAFTCMDCNKHFNYKKNFLAHIRKFHSSLVSIESKTVLVTCALCNMAVSKDEYSDHVRNVHDVQLITETLEFPSCDEFIKWKASVEHDEQNTFIKKHGNKRTKSGQEKTYFYCHRSGHYQGRGTGRRHIKKQNSKKINSYCPANIKLVIKEDGACSVSYLKTHVGHENELCHLTLSATQRKALAAKIAAKVPFGEILNEVKQDSIVNEKLERIHLLTRKDLLNIQSTFNLNSNSEKSNDETNVGAWVTISADNEDNGSLQDDVPEDDDDISQMLIFQLGSTESSDESFTKKKEDFVAEIKTFVDDVTSEEEFNILQECMAAARLSIEALRAAAVVEK